MMLSENIPQMYKIRVTDGLPKNDCHTSTMTLFLVWEVGIIQFTGLSTFNREETLTSNQTLQYFGANPSPTSPIIWNLTHCLSHVIYNIYFVLQYAFLYATESFSAGWPRKSCLSSQNVCWLLFCGVLTLMTIKPTVQVGLKLSIQAFSNEAGFCLSHTDLTLERRFLSYCAPKGAAGKSGLFQIPNNLNWVFFLWSCLLLTKHSFVLLPGYHVPTANLCFISRYVTEY